MTMHTMRVALETAREEAGDYLAAHGCLPADGASANDLFLLTDDLANRFFEAKERDARFREALRSYALKPHQINELTSCANERVAPQVGAAYVFGLAVGLHLRYLRGEQP